MPNDPTLRRELIQRVLDYATDAMTDFPGYQVECTRIVNPHQLQIRVWKVDPDTAAQIGAPRYFTVKVTENQ